LYNIFTLEKEAFEKKLEKLPKEKRSSVKEKWQRDLFEKVYGEMFTNSTWFR